MFKVQPSLYLHGSAPEEQARLLRMNEFINAASMAKLTLNGGERILEVGSGLGTFARQMARVAGGARVVCIEPDDTLIDRSRELAAEVGEDSLLDVRRGDATDLPLRHEEWNSFDLVHCRFVLEHVREPQLAVQHMARALRPGGRLVLADDDHDLLRLWPPLPAVDELWRAYIRAFSDLGNDPFVGRKLVAMMRVADLTPVRNDYVFFGGCAGSEHWEAVVANLVGIFRGARKQILATSAIAADLFDEVVEGLSAWGTRADSALWYPICWAEAARPD